MRFRWNDWNLDHATRHGVPPNESERVVEAARAPYPEEVGDGKVLVIGHFEGEPDEIEPS